MKKFLVISLFLCTIFFVEKASACTCRDIEPDKDIEQKVGRAYQYYYAIFSAKVLSIQKAKTPDRSNKIVLRLNKSWKGNLGKSILLSTASVSSMCGFPFEKGKTYLIYAFGPRKELSTSICTRTALIDDNKDIAVLDELKKKP